MDGVFNGDNRAVSFAICADGLNPFAKDKNTYSMCPIFLIPLNLPHHLRKMSGAMMLCGIIPGPGEPKDMDPYVDVVVQNGMDLNKKVLYDGYRDEMFKYSPSHI